MNPKLKHFICLDVYLKKMIRMSNEYKNQYFFSLLGEILNGVILKEIRQAELHAG
jgi:hypothetical protein